MALIADRGVRQRAATWLLQGSSIDVIFFFAFGVKSYHLQKAGGWLVAAALVAPERSMQGHQNGYRGKSLPPAPPTRQFHVVGTNSGECSPGPGFVVRCCTMRVPAVVIDAAFRAVRLVCIGRAELKMPVPVRLAGQALQLPALAGSSLTELSSAGTVPGCPVFAYA